MLRLALETVGDWGFVLSEGPSADGPPAPRTEAPRPPHMGRGMGRPARPGPGHGPGRPGLVWGAAY